MPLNYYYSLPTQLLALLRAGHTVAVRWDCGSDDHIVTTLVDGEEQEFDYGDSYWEWTYAGLPESEGYLVRINSLPVLLACFLPERLGLPSVGEFHLQGGGRISLEGSAIVLEYQSDATAYVENPNGWWPEEYLSAAELLELRPERLQPGAPDPEPMLYQPDPEMAADYSGREVLFKLG